MKKIAALAMALLLGASAQAIRPRPVAVSVTQRDGTTISVVKHGNDHFAFYTTLDGKIVVRNADGNFCYAALTDGMLTATSIVAHDQAQRSADEATFARRQALTPQHAAAQKQEASARKRKSIVASTSDGLGKYGTSAKGAASSIGAYTIPVIMVQFSDLKFQSTTTVEKMTRFYNEAGYSDESGCVGSVRDYFISQSGGMFQPTFEITGIVTLSSGYKTYGGNDSNGYDKGWTNYKFLKDCIAAAEKQGTDFKKYVNGSGVPLVAILYAGPGEATDYSSNSENYLWPAEEDCDIDINGVHYNSLFMGNELDTSGDDDGVLMGMGVFCHEFGHALGLPDFYVTDYSYESDDPFGYWDIMDGGAYVNDSRAPIGYTAYERSYMGWLNLEELGSTAKKVTLNDIDAANGTNAVIIRNGSTETFVLENRHPGTWYPSAFGSGLMLSRYAYNSSAWSNNTLNNTQSKKRACILTADGAKLSYGTNVSQKNLYGNGVNDITSLTTYAGTKKTDAPIYNITKSGTDITFYYLSTNLSPYAEGESFDADGLTFRYMGNDEVYVKASTAGSYSGALSIPSTFVKDDVTYTVVGIDTLAFANCPSLTSVSIPATVTSIAADAFRSSTALTQISVDAKNTAYQSVDGVLFSRSSLLDSVTTAGIRAAQAEGTLTTTFDFAANTLGLPVSTSSSTSAGNITAPITLDDVTLTTTDGGTATRMWQATSGTELRVYNNGGSLTFSVPEKQKIKEIVFTYKKLALSASTGTLTSGTWTGAAQSVTFTASGTSQIQKVAVTYTAGTPAEAVLLAYPAAHGTAYSVPAPVSRIAAYAFEGAAVQTLVLPDSLQTLDKLSVSTSALTRLTSKTLIPAATDGDPFTAVDKTRCTLTVPEGAESAYKAADYWKDFLLTSGISSAPTSGAAVSKGTLFDLSGRRVFHPTRGIYIQNGHKILVR